MDVRWTHVYVAALLALCADSCLAASRLNITSMYSSKNRERAVRPRTDYIILHTTEGPKKGSLNKVRRNGETHYFVDTAGRVYRIIDKRKVALHAGRSMWNGRTNIDNCSVGIEIVGYHNKSITSAQYKALKILIVELQTIFRVSDQKVLTHSMVAYGAPNRWHRTAHRGRKRCGMQFAKRSVRRKLGLTKAPDHDPDVRAGRLTVADRHLASVLYGGSGGRESGNTIGHGDSAWDIAGDGYNKAETLYVFPDGKQVRGDQISDWRKMPVGTKVVEGSGSGVVGLGRMASVANLSAMTLAGNTFAAETTIYVFPDGRVKGGHELTDGESASLPVKTRVYVGYRYGGKIARAKSAFDICGPAWNADTTVYILPDGSATTGDEINERAIPRNTVVLFR